MKQIQNRLAAAVFVLGLALIFSSQLAVLGQNLLTSIQPVAGTGTAGTPAGGVLTIQGAASMTKLLVTPDSVALPANQSVNVAQMNGVTTSMNSGASDTGTQRVQLANDFDPCRNQSNTRSFVSVNQTTSTQILGLSGASKKYYICSIDLVTATAQNIAVVDSTTAGNACATSPSGSAGFGGSTAATGWNFAANGGLTYGAGGFAVGATTNSNAALCVLQSGSGQLSGGFSYVTQ
jgi:hypothetical protein